MYYDEREYCDAMGLPYVRKIRRPLPADTFADPVFDAVVDKEQREIEALMRHPAYRRERGRVRQVRQG